MRYIVLALVLIGILGVGCSPSEESIQAQLERDKQIQSCRDYLKKSDYIITNHGNKYQYQTDNYTIDLVGNLTVNKYVIVRSDRDSDYSIYKTKMVLASGTYMVEWLK